MLAKLKTLKRYFVIAELGVLEIFIVFVLSLVVGLLDLVGFGVFLPLMISRISNFDIPSFVFKILDIFGLEENIVNSDIFLLIIFLLFFIRYIFILISNYSLAFYSRQCALALQDLAIRSMQYNVDILSNNLTYCVELCSHRVELIANSFIFSFLNIGSSLVIISVLSIYLLSAMPVTALTILVVLFFWVFLHDKFFKGIIDRAARDLSARNREAYEGISVASSSFYHFQSIGWLSRLNESINNNFRLSAFAWIKNDVLAKAVRPTFDMFLFATIAGFVVLVEADVVRVDGAVSSATTVGLIISLVRLAPLVNQVSANLVKIRASFFAVEQFDRWTTREFPRHPVNSEDHDCVVPSLSLNKPTINFKDIYWKGFESKFGVQIDENSGRSCAFRLKRMDNDKSLFFESLNVTINEGEWVLITGDSGVGKSSLMRKFVVPDETVSAFAGEIEAGSLKRGCIGFADRNPCLLNGDILGNLIGGSARDDQGALFLAREFMDISGLTSEGLSLNTTIEGRAGCLSSGQLQRVALGRVVLSGRSILVLDEALSGVSAVVEDRLLAWVSERLPNAFVFYVSHRENLWYRKLFDVHLEILLNKG